MGLRRIGIIVVDNNEPLEENIPSIHVIVTDGVLYDGKVWGDYSIDPSKVENHHLSGSIMCIFSSLVE